MSNPARGSGSWVGRAGGAFALAAALAWATGACTTFDGLTADESSLVDGADGGAPTVTATPCTGPADCDSHVCGPDKTCAPPSPTDGVKNGAETDVDCGGGAPAPKCAVGKACKVNDDCELLACTNGACVVPTDTDGVKNGGETDTDCGGPGVSAGGVTYKGPPCAVDKTCATDGDCRTGACAPGKNKCALPSCATAETAGIDTCGGGETGEAGASHDSCCTSLVLPTKTDKRLDKYEITAGRFRTFLTKAGPNLRAWVASYVAKNPQSQLAKMVASFPVLASIYPAADRLDALSLTAHMSFDIDNYGGFRGCYNGPTNYSANTYWQDATHLADFGLPPRSLPRSASDEKPLNCVMPIMYAAFCAWDGDAELPTYDDYLDAWPANQQFPWGPTNYCTDAGGDGMPGNFKPCDAFNWCNGPFMNGGFKCQNLSYTALSEAGIYYEWPRNTDRAKDNSPLIAAPGRFTKDATLAKSGGEAWYDLMGNLGEYTGDFAANAGSNNTFCDYSATPAAGSPTCTRANRAGAGTLYSNIPAVGLLGDTWEGHQYATGTGHGQLPDKTNVPATFQYGKFGARCVRKAQPY